MLTPTIHAATIEKAVLHGMQQLKQELLNKSKRLIDAEHRISSLEDEQAHFLPILYTTEKLCQSLLEKVDYQENRSHRSNLLIVCLPKNYSVSILHALCECVLSQALGLKHKCIVERAYRHTVSIAAILPQLIHPSQAGFVKGRPVTAKMQGALNA